MNIFTMLLCYHGDERTKTDEKQQGQPKVFRKKPERESKKNRKTIDYTPKWIFEGTQKTCSLVSQAWFHQTKPKNSWTRSFGNWRQDDKGTWKDNGRRPRL